MPGGFGQQELRAEIGGWGGSGGALPGSAVCWRSAAGPWLVFPLFGGRAAALSARTVPAVWGQPRDLAGGRLCLSRRHAGRGGGGAGGAQREGRRWGGRTRRRQWGAAGAGLAPQPEGGLGKGVAGAVAGGRGAVVAASPESLRASGRLAGSAASLAVAVLPVFVQWVERFVARRPAAVEAAGGLHRLWYLPPARACGQDDPARFGMIPERHPETLHHAGEPARADRAVSLRGHQ